MERLISAFGLFAMLGIAWLLSADRKNLNLRVIIGGVGLQVLLASVILNDFATPFFEAARAGTQAIIGTSDIGAKFIFGPDFGKVFAFSVLPTIIFVSALSSVLFHWGILQRVVQGLAWVMYKVMGISGSESLAAAANVFVGQTEAPLLVKPYLKSMTRSEIMCLMTGGMATVAGGVLAAYVKMGIDAGHLLAASLMSAPAAIVIAKILVPETAVSPTAQKISLTLEKEGENVIDAACKGASDGLKLALNVGAMLLAFIALIALANLMLAQITGLFGVTLTVQQVIGVAFYPFAFLMGVPAAEVATVGQLLGEKVIINEFYAYMNLAALMNPADGIAAPLSERSAIIATYALCGFANISSVAIQIGGIGGLEPTRKRDFAALGFRAMIGGSLAAFMTACIAGVLV